MKKTRQSILFSFIPFIGWLCFYSMLDIYKKNMCICFRVNNKGLPNHWYFLDTDIKSFYYIFQHYRKKSLASSIFSWVSLSGSTEQEFFLIINPTMILRQCFILNSLLSLTLMFKNGDYPWTHKQIYTVKNVTDNGSS